MSDSVHFLDGGGEAAIAIRAHDWSSHALGSPDGWPAALKTALSMALNSKFPKCVVWGPGFVSFPNDAFTPILGRKPAALGLSFSEIWSEVWDEIGPIAERAYAGEATFIENFALTIDRQGFPEPCHFTFCYSPIRDENGVVRGMIDTVIETTGAVEAQKQTRLLAGELGHRIKNMLSVVSAIVSQTLETAGVEGDAKTALIQRIGALAEAQSLLTPSHAAEADIRDVVHQSLLPFRIDTGRFVIDGPPVDLSAGQALMLALAINELATNAIKYGALSSSTGTVQILWSVGSATDDVFRLTWQETDGPPVAQPHRRGFGSRIISQALPQEFRGEAALAYDTAGLRFELQTRMLHLGGDGAAAA